MIINVPTHDDFAQHGFLFLNLAWDSVFELFWELEIWTESDETIQPSDHEKYWAAAQKPLCIAHALAQQGAELILKSMIAAQSPYLLICESAREWPKGCDRSDTAFAEFRTMDAQDLVRACNAVATIHLPDQFVSTFDKFRKQRNALFHTVDKRLSVTAREIVAYVLESVHLVAPHEWPALRRTYLESLPASQLGAPIVGSILIREFQMLIDELGHSELLRFFGFDKKKRRFICPRCYWELDDGLYDSYPLYAQLKPNTPSSTNLYCFVCDNNTVVRRKRCGDLKCKGNVINTNDDCECLTCFEPQSHD